MSHPGSRSVALVCAASFVLFGSRAAAQTPLYTLHGDGTGSGFGQSVAAAGDVDGDGFDDVIVGAPNAFTSVPNGGVASVYSGLSGSLLFEYAGVGPLDFLGCAVAGIGDIDLDGFDDFALGARGDDAVAKNAGAIGAFSGKTGNLLFVRGGDVSGDALGTTIAGVGDVEDDGVADFVAGMPGSDLMSVDGGAIRVFSGRTGVEILTHYGTVQGERLGTTVAPGGDLDQDSHDDLLATGSKGAVGRVLVISGKSGKKLLDLLGSPLGDGFGRSIACIGDASGDGVDDFLVGAPFSDLGGPGAGAVFVYSGADASVLRVTLGDTPAAMLGMSVAAAEDVDGDGRADYAVGVPGQDVKPVTPPKPGAPGAPGAPDGDDDVPGGGDGDDDDDDGGGGGGGGGGNPPPGTLFDAGQVRVYSGATGALLYSVNGTSAGGLFGWSTALLGDANQDGIVDLVASALLDDRAGAEVGSARVFSAKPLALSIDEHLVSLSSGGVQSMQLDVGASKAGYLYWVVGGGSGTYPGVDTSFGHLQINFDAYFDFTLSTPLKGVMLAPLGALDAAGRAKPSFVVAPTSSPDFEGLTLHHAAVLIHPTTLEFDSISNAVPLTFLP